MDLKKILVLILLTCNANALLGITDCQSNQSIILNGQYLQVNATITMGVPALSQFIILFNDTQVYNQTATTGTNTASFMVNQTGNVSVKCNVTDVGLFIESSTDGWVYGYTTTTTTTTTLSPDTVAIIVAINNQTQIITNGITAQTEVITYLINNQTDIQSNQMINQTTRIIYTLNNQTEIMKNESINIRYAIQNQTSTMNNGLIDISRMLNIFKQQLGSLLEYDMRNDAHYRIQATNNLNCTFIPSNIMLEKYTIGKNYNPTGDLEDGLYCFKVTEYDPTSRSYGLSDKRLLYVNNSNT